jgi:Fe-S-cluster containining protein
MPLADLNRYAQTEFNTAVPELRARPVHEAQLRFYQRLNEALGVATAASTQALACKAGCDYCCHYKIEVTPAEVLTIQQHVVRHFKPEQIQQVMAQARRNVAEAKGLSRQAQTGINQRCAFLLNQQCSIYEVRPSNCRSYHATDVKVCKASFHQPDVILPKIQVEAIEDAGGGLASGFEQAMDSLGMDSKLYDFSSAFVEAMGSPTLAQRIKSGKKAFVKAKLAGAG